MTGVFETVLEADEILEAVHLPTLSSTARFGYYKICRKTGEFAEAIGAVLFDRDRQLMRVVAGATNGAPIVIEGAPPTAGLERDWIRAHLVEGGISDSVELQLHLIAVERAANKALT
jgi:carbon-monoxide dehydrogenase medium subunit